jgi:hypothetical protein
MVRTEQDADEQQELDISARWVFYHVDNSRTGFFFPGREGSQKQPESTQVFQSPHATQCMRGVLIPQL